MGIPTRNDIKLDRYSQSILTLGSSGGIIIIPIIGSWFDLTLTENITSIDTSSDPVWNEGVTISILITQDAATAYTIDWLASGKFISTLPELDLQPGTTLGYSTRYTLTWEGSQWRINIDKEFILSPYSPSAQLVIARMTDPSIPFQEAINEYVNSEQLALNDNWILTDEVQAYNVDTEVNALTGWRQKIPTVIGSPTFIPYEGIITDGVSQYINTQYILDEVGNLVLTTDTRVSIFIATIDQAPPATAMVLGADAGSDNRIWFYHSSGDKRSLVNVAVDLVTSGSFKDDTVYHLMFKNGANRLFENGIELGFTNLGEKSLATIPMYIGCRNQGGTAANFINGTFSFATMGLGADFDEVANYAAQRKFHDRMLIQKHIIEVNTVLDRYTDLTDRETFALSRLVARSEENGQWALMDEVFMLGLYTEANSLIGMKLKTATYNVKPTYISGKGWNFAAGTLQELSTNYNVSIDATRETLGNCNKGVIYTDFVESGVNLRFLWKGSDDYCFLYPNRKLDGRVQGGNFTSIAGNAESHNYIGFVRSSTIGVNGLYGFINESNLTITAAAIALQNATVGLGNNNSSIEVLNGTIQAWHTGEGEGFDETIWGVDLKQAVNELEIGKAGLVDWDAQDKTYDWSSRELDAYQLEELVTIINTNCDSVTTGRTLDIQGHLGITLNCQIFLDLLVIKGFVILQ